MSKLDDVLNTVGNDVQGAYQKIATLWTKAKQAWTLISSPQVRAVMLKLGADAVKIVKDTEITIAANVAQPASPISLALDAEVYNDIKQIIADAKAGDGVIVADLKVLGITL